MIGKILSVVKTVKNGAKITQIQADPGGGNNSLSELFAAAGDDCAPIPGDFIVLLPVKGKGRFITVGILDPVNDQKAGPGDRRIYARDSGGASVVEVWLKSDGSAIIDNGSGSIELQSGGDCVINGVTISTNGNIETSGEITAQDLTAAGVIFSTHIHQQPNDSSGDTESPTGPPL